MTPDHIFDQSGPLDPRRDPRPGDEVAELLVVCTGNVARSPLFMVMLEHEVRRRLGSRAPVWVRSAGVHALRGHPAVSESCRLATARGLDLARHRGAVIDDADVARADLVLAMTESQRGALATRAPAATARVFTVRELARLVAALDPLDEAELTPRERIRLVTRLAHGSRPYVARPPHPEDVADPYGRPQLAYDRMGAELDELLDVVAPRLFGPVRGPQG